MYKPKVVLASSNAGKLVELRCLLQPLELEIIPQGDLAVNSADETGLTFVENALLKARHASRLTNLPALGEDSGLQVDYLHGSPGIYSARYSGTGKAEDNNQKLLQALDGVEFAKRAASFRCVMVYLKHYKDQFPLICQASWHGFILEQPRGQAGFGYDPIFWDPQHQASAAELTQEIKNSCSHRAKVCSKLLSVWRQAATCS